MCSFLHVHVFNNDVYAKSLRLIIYSIIIVLVIICNWRKDNSLWFKLRTSDSVSYSALISWMFLSLLKFADCFFIWNLRSVFEYIIICISEHSSRSERGWCPQLPLHYQRIYASRWHHTAGTCKLILNTNGPTCTVFCTELCQGMAKYKSIRFNTHLLPCGLMCEHILTWCSC